MFFNISNHPSKGWPEMECIEAFALGGELVDLPMPNITCDLTDDQLRKMAHAVALDVVGMAQGQKSAAMVAGEYSFSILVIAELQAAGIPCYFGKSERVAVEKPREDGLVDIIHTFEFRGFRRAPEIRLA